MAPAIMIALRHFMAVRRRALLALVLAALGMNALVPAGTMIAPAGDRFAAIILCPDTHPLARAFAAKLPAELAALHAAMGHGPTDHASIDHAAMDHAAMGHASAAPANDPADQPASTSAAPQSCAFTGLALAALLPDCNDNSAAAVAMAPALPARIKAWAVAAPAHLRPPLRAPPALS